jgi:phytanoyl-CoA hydroxylase
VIRHFWEEKAFGPDGEPVQPLDKCINKIGHALHDLNPKFQKVSYEGRVGTICKELGIEVNSWLSCIQMVVSCAFLQIPTVVQSMYIFKQPNIGGAVNAHQDGTFLYTTPQSVLGFWWPLDNCTMVTRCLLIVLESPSIFIIAGKWLSLGRPWFSQEWG